jgi:hypothetical protein
MKLFIYSLTVIFYGLNAIAIGTLNFEAKIDSFDEKSVVLELKDATKIRVAKTSLTSEQQKQLKPGGTLAMSLSEKTIRESTLKPTKK